ncbi:MAG: AMP-binding protein [Bacteroidota bacterium]
MSKLHENLQSQLEYFYRFEKETPNAPFLKQPYGDNWTTLTYRDAGQMARKMVNALRSMGLKKGDHIGLLSKNCYHWVVSDLAIMMGGYVSVPFYANLSGDSLRTVLDLSDAKLLIIGKLDKWDGVEEAIPEGMPVIKFPHYPGNAEVTVGEAWDELLAKHQPITENFLPDLKSTWTILFTSGTTGTPKGVIHTYENAALIINNEVHYNALGLMGHDQNIFFSFLPLNHIAERAAVELGTIMTGGCVSFVESLDTFAKNLADTQPTFMFAVPRIWTKFQLGILAKMPQQKLDRLLKIPIVSGLVKKKLHKALGLSRARDILTGASLTPESLKQWYRKIGLNLREVYGMTENFGAFCLMPPDQHKPNTVGRPVPNAEGRIDPDTGEILMKMPWMMTGYYKDEEKTAEVLVDDWLHTGDKGLMDDEGFFKVVGRVKDAFKTSKGKFVVPTILEDKFAENDFIEQICVAGLGIPQPIALVNLSEVALKEDASKIQEVLQNQLKEANKTLHGHERISTLIVTKEAWAPENKLLTPTLKIRRTAIDEKYIENYGGWHEDKADVIFE